MGDDERDAFGNPIARHVTSPPQPASSQPEPDLGNFSPPVAPAPKRPPGGALAGAPAPPAGPDAPNGGRHTIATGHPAATQRSEWTRSPQPTETAPGATGALALGIGSLFFPPLGPFAWYQGRRVTQRIVESRGQLGGRGMATTAIVLGVLVTILWAVAIIAEVVDRVS